MKNMKKRVGAIITSLLFFLLPISACKGGSTLKTLDMYLIGGQSNASGSSRHLNQLLESYENVGYAGQCDLAYATGTPVGNSNVSSFNEFYWKVEAGYGGRIDQVGPEYGMAQVFNDQYQGDKKAFIFKSAAGGAPLLDGVEWVYGNWYPRSLWEEGYSPETAKQKTGWQYYWFVENFRNVYTELKANGYEPKVKGMIWMQGCADLAAPNIYEDVIEVLISDLRNDLKEITGDESLGNMPFVIGKIATSFDGWANPLVPAFNAMQERVAQNVANVGLVETSDLIIVNEDGSINGSDQYHFNWKDMETLGVRFGTKLLEMNKE